MTHLGIKVKKVLSHLANNSTLASVDYHFYILEDQVRKFLGRDPDIDEVNSALFTCVGGPRGEIYVKDVCDDGCLDRGNGLSDVCS